MSDWIGRIGTALGDAGKGAATGAALGPIGAAAGGAIGLALDLVPDLAKVIGRNAGVAQQVVATVQAVTGTPDPGLQHAALADQTTAANLRIQLAEISTDHEQSMEDARLDRFKAAVADVASARAQTVQLAQTGSKIAWGSAVVSVVVVLGFFGSLAGLLLVKRLEDAGVAAMVNMIVGGLVAGFASVLGYWLGSSAGSARKTELMAQQVPTPPTPGVIVPAADVEPAR